MKRFLLILILLAALAAVGLTVPIHGRTLWQRVLGPAPEPGSAQANSAADGVDGRTRDKAGPGEAAAAAKKGPAASQPAVDLPDHHSDEDRKALDDLIDQKLKATK